MKLCGTLCLCGGITLEKTHHRDTEYPQRVTELVESYAEKRKGKAMRRASLGARGLVLCVDISARSNAQDN